MDPQEGGFLANVTNSAASRRKWRHPNVLVDEFTLFPWDGEDDQEHIVEQSK